MSQSCYVFIIGVCLLEEKDYHLTVNYEPTINALCLLLRCLLSFELKLTLTICEV